ncbi:hypothetical protein MRX58_13195 (plasmid) [Xylella fastidiosa subsp. pauca]|uniref:hypothetical protein n=1 Tax=Xylella fastidiosa TaxID=2371 RepID=UPI00241F4D12|nr:hypothetical protein [Xylella fastidiosa]MDG5824453.1 hypothetical protein [Xylella fastidiosa subsp. pauca]
MVEIQDFRGRENTDYETRKAKGRGFVDSALRAPTYDRGQQKTVAHRRKSLPTSSTA